MPRLSPSVWKSVTCVFVNSVHPTTGLDVGEVCDLWSSLREVVIAGTSWQLCDNKLMILMIIVY